MKQQKKTFSILIRAFMVMVVSVGCIKKRADQPVQGSGLAHGEVVLKAEVLNITEALTAGKKVNEATQKSYKITVEESAKDIFDDYGFVAYETNSKLLQNGVRVVAKPGAKYELKRKLVGEKLVIYKVSKAQNISYLEKTSLVEKFGDDKIGVPLVSFPVSYYNIVYVKDADNRNTNQKREERVAVYEDYTKATHIRVNYSNRTVYNEDLSGKTSLIPKDFLSGREWYFSVFKTNSSDYQAGGNRFEFLYSKESNQFGIYRRVKFEAESETVFMGKSSVVPSEVKGNPISRADVVPLVGEWVQLRVEEDLAGNEKEVRDSSGSYRDSKFFKVDFLKSFEQIAKTSIYGYGARSASLYKATSVKEVIVAKDLLSFIVENDRVQYRVNFWEKKESAYKPIVAHFEDKTHMFGIMYSKAPVQDETIASQTEEDLKKIFRMVRFDPEKKEVVYHLSQESPDVPSVQISAKKAVRYVNDSFAYIYRDRPEERMTVKLSEKRVRRGDPRYNILDYNSERNSRTPGGLGNPYFDEMTGEVVKATAFIYYGSYLNLVRSSLNEYLQTKTGLSIGFTDISKRPWAHQNLGQKDLSFESLGVPFMAISMSEESRKDLVRNTPEKLGVLLNPLAGFESASINSLCLDENCIKTPNSVRKINLLRNKIPMGDVDVFIRGALSSVASVEGNGGLDHNIFMINRRSAFGVFEKACDLKNIESIYRAKNGGADFLKTDIVENCVQTVLADVFVPTTVHEILHNFGIGHNMAGSTDVKNYLTKEMVKDVYKEELEDDISYSGTNSIMDYFEYRTGELPYPSTHDWASLRFIYRSQIEDVKSKKWVSLLNGEVVDVLNKKITNTFSVEEAKKSGLVEPREYAYCLQAEIALGVNPMCDMFDTGSSPLEIVKNYIEEYNYELQNNSKRGIKSNFNPYWSDALRARKLTQILKFYHQWRKLLYGLLGDENKYLEEYTDTSTFYRDFSEKLSKLSVDARERVLGYFQARNTIYNFYRNQVFMAPLTCMYGLKYQGKEMSPEFVDFDLMYRKIIADADHFDVDEVFDCSSLVMQNVSKQYIVDKIKFSQPKLKDSDLQLVYLASFGEPVRVYNNLVYDSLRSTGSGDFLGFGEIKFFSAINLLTRRYAPDFEGSEYFFPSFMDEPEFRNNFEFFLKVRFTKGYWIGASGSLIRTVNLSSEQYQSFLKDPEHANFRKIMNAYGKNALLDFKIRNSDPEFQYGFKLSDVEQSGHFISSPYLQNILIADSMGENEGNLDLVMRSVFNKTLRLGFISESNNLPAIASMFRSSLTVPNNFSATKERTKKYMVGVLSSDYVRLNMVRREFKYVADLGSFIVYAKDEASTFSKDLIQEVDRINRVKVGLNAPGVNKRQIKHFLDTVIGKLDLEFPTGRAIFNLPEERKPTVLYYQKISEAVISGTNAFLDKNEHSMNLETISAVILISKRVSRYVVEEAHFAANQVNLDWVGTRGQKLTYSQALEEMVVLAVEIEENENALLVLPTAAIDLEAKEKAKKDLFNKISAFQREQILIESRTSSKDGSVKNFAVVGLYDLMIELGRVLKESDEKKFEYVINSKDLDEKKELLSKFLLSLALSR